ncbi:MAG: hypothetical protein GX621_11165, partial [Pirellulaceae bacterium]|nr:hypothetical protein [Pirellulaceae bacterium]
MLCRTMLALALGCTIPSHTAWADVPQKPQPPTFKVVAGGESHRTAAE